MSEIEPRQYLKGQVLTAIDWDDWVKSSELEVGWNFMFITFIGEALRFEEGNWISVVKITADQEKAKCAFLQFSDDNVVSLHDFLANPALWPVGTALIIRKNNHNQSAWGVLHTETGFFLIEQQQIQFAGTRIRLDADADLFEHDITQGKLMGYLEGNYCEIKAAYDKWVAEKNPPEPLLIAQNSPVTWRENGRRPPMGGGIVSIQNVEEWNRLVTAVEQCGEDKEDILEVKECLAIYGISSVGYEITAMPLYSDDDPNLRRRPKLKSRRNRRNRKKPPGDSK